MAHADSDSLPDYAILDPILEAFIEEDLTVDEICARGFERATVGRSVICDLELSDKAVSGTHVEIEVFDEPEVAAARHRAGLRRLFALQLRDTLKALDRQLPEQTAMGAAFMAFGGTLDDDAALAGRRRRI